VTKDVKSKVGLASAIETLRQELSDAVLLGRRKDLRLKIEGIELELAVVCEIGDGGKASFSVLGFGAELKADEKITNTHRVKLSLKPEQKNESENSEEKDVYVSDNGAKKPG
jgi:hypothetical protein